MPINTGDVNARGRRGPARDFIDRRGAAIVPYRWLRVWALLVQWRPVDTTTIMAARIMRLAGAQQRLLEAFERLESAVEASQAGSVAAQSQLSQELASVRMDRDALRVSTQRVSGRLDGALARLDRLLEE